MTRQTDIARLLCTADAAEMKTGSIPSHPVDVPAAQRLHKVSINESRF